MEKYDERGYRLLATAIVEQAAKDAMGWGYTAGSTEYHSRNRQIEEVKDFFCNKNSLFVMYMPNTDGVSLYKRIMNNYKVYGRYNP